MEDYEPPTEPAGALVPPPRVPPTALATVPAPAPLERRGESELEFGTFARLLDATLDVVDEVADSVAQLLRLRRADEPT